MTYIFIDVLLICPTLHRDAINHYINSDPSSSSFSSLNVDIQTFDDTQDSPAGTAAVLSHFATRIQTDFIVLPCDFLPPPSLRLESILNNFRLNTETDGSIGTALFYEMRSRSPADTDKTTAAFEDAWGSPDPPMPIVYSSNGSGSRTLLHIDSPDSQDISPDELLLRSCTLTSYPRSTLSTRLVDADVYVLRRSVLDALLLKRSTFDSIREDFIPWLCKLSTHPAKRQKYLSILFPTSSQTHSQALALQHSTSNTPQALQTLKAPASEDSITSSPDIGDIDDTGRKTMPSLRMGLVIHHLSDGLALRANNLFAYLELNRLLLNTGAGASSQVTVGPSLSTSPSSTKPQPLIDPKATITPDTVIGSSTRIGARSSVKKSSIGSHCLIGSNVKLTGCVVLDHCVIEDGSKLDGCILGRGTKVGPRAEMSRCVTQGAYEVEEGTIIKNERLEVSDWTSRAAQGEDSDDEGEGDENSEELSE